MSEVEIEQLSKILEDEKNYIAMLKEFSEQSSDPRLSTLFQQVCASHMNFYNDVSSIIG